MKRILSFSVFVLLIIYVLTGWNSLAAQNTGDNDRYNLAVYATGLQSDQPISSSLLTVVQNKTITKLTGEGNYRLIERSNEFLRQIQNEQVMQQSGEVADGQIADIGAGLGAQKICVVSITIIEKYLYIATRIVDVATKTSYESGDAQVSNYKSNNIPLLTQTLDKALNNMMAVSSKTKAAPVTPTIPAEKTKQAKTTSEVPTQQEASPKPDVTIQQETAPKPSIVSSNTPAQAEARPKVEKVPSSAPTQPERSDVSSQQSSNLTVAEAKAEKERAKVLAKAEAANAKAEFNAGFKAYKDRVKKEKGGFLEVNSLAYKEYRKYRANMISGSILLSVGAGLFISGMVVQDVQGHYERSFLRESFPDYDFSHFDLSTFSDYCDDRRYESVVCRVAVRAINETSYYMLYDDRLKLYCYDYWHTHECSAMWAPGLAVMTTGLIQLCCLNHPLKKSYQYYINGDQKTATLNFHPYIGGNHTFGAGLTLRF